MIRFLLALACLAFSLSSFAISENGFQQTYDREVKPYFASGVSGTLLGVGNIELAYKKFEVEAEQGALVIVSGRSENYDRYAELIYDLKPLGYSVYILDHRGQGHSGRLTKDPQVGYVRHFTDYVEDLEKFMTEVVSAKAHQRTILLSHSMGGAISALYLQRHPGVIDRAVFVAPMFEINTGKYSEFMANLLSGFNIFIGKGKSYAPGQGPAILDFPFSKNFTTHCEARYNALQEIWKTQPELALGGPSNRWVHESLKATKGLRNGPGTDVPILLLQAGQDQLVRPHGQDLYCAHSAHCEKVVFADSGHEILEETDAVRDQALLSIKNFIQP